MWAFERALPPEAWAISVRAPFASEGGFGWTIPGQADSFEKGLAALRQFIEQVPASYAIDPQRIIVMGFSQGAAMAYALLLAQPQLITGIAALAGFIPEPARAWATPNHLAGKPVFIAHGTEDSTVPLADAESARDLLTGCGAQVTYITDPTGHKVGTLGMRALKTWLATEL
jgi:phospholipase/carboxylesterase